MIVIVLVVFWDWLPYARACLKVIVVSAWGVFLVILCYYVCVWFVDLILLWVRVVMRATLCISWH